MDPLSIIASSIAILSTVSASLEQVRKFYGAKTEVLNLINEVSDLRLVLEEVDRTAQQRMENANLQDAHARAITTVLKSAESDFVVLNGLINKGVARIHVSTGQHKVGRFSWMHHKSKLKQLQSQLKDTRVTLATLCSSATMSDMSKIQFQLTNVTVLQDDHRAQLVAQNKLLEMLVKQFQDPDPVSSSGEVHEERRSTPSAPSAGIGAYGPVETFDPESTTAANPPQADIIPQHGFTHINSAGDIRISAARHRETRCKGWCSCRCHQPQTRSTPTATKLLIGSLFIGYSGIPSLSQRCSEKTCRRHSNPSLRISYQFPGWFLNRILQFALLGCVLDGPQISIRAPRVVPDNSDIFVFAVQGNIQRMMSLFESGAASPFDVGAGTGRTALHYAVNYSHPQLAKCLLHAGANPQAEDHEHATTTALAWRRIFGSLAEEPVLDAFRIMFEDEEFIETRVFQPLHKIVLGLSHAKLEDQLLLTTSNIDDADSDGRTALSWAATRGDIEAVSTLLRFGADVNVPSHWGQRALHFAAQNQRESLMPILQLLVGNGAEVNALDYWNRTALIYASGNHSSNAPLRLLVERGTALDVRDRRLRTALGYAARLCTIQHRHLDFLLMSGADPQLPDEFNVLPLLESIKHNHHGNIRLLLPASKPLQAIPLSSSLLHWIARHGDSTTMNIILEDPLDTLFHSSDVGLTDGEGYTPQEVLERRVDIAKHERNTFNALVQRILELVHTNEISQV